MFDNKLYCESLTKHCVFIILAYFTVESSMFKTDSRGTASQFEASGLGPKLPYWMSWE